MEVTRTPLEGLLVIRPRIFVDDRGSFFEPFNATTFAKMTGVDAHFVQDNESVSEKDVLRGLHLQAPPSAQAKLVRVVKGAVLDVCVDVRPGSATYGQYFKMRLDGRERVQLYIPEGFAHGFAALETDTVFAYKCTAYYDPGAERTIRWNDPDLGIDWGVVAPIVSAKDNAGAPFSGGAWAN